MKTLQFLTGTCLLCAILPASGQQQQAMTDAMTQQQLLAARRQAQVQAGDPARHELPDQSKDPSKKNQPQDILSRSDILCFNGIATLVPKQAILAVPRQFADRVGMKTGAKIVTWMEFYSANRGWVTAQEITMAQAQGKEPLPEALNERLGKSSNIIVSTLEGGPISKLQYTPPPAPGATK